MLKFAKVSRTGADRWSREEQARWDKSDNFYNSDPDNNIDLQVNVYWEKMEQVLCRNLISRRGTHHLSWPVYVDRFTVLGGGSEGVGLIDSSLSKLNQQTKKIYINIFVCADAPFSGGAPSSNMGSIVKPLAGASWVGHTTFLPNLTFTAAALSMQLTKILWKNKKSDNKWKQYEPRFTWRSH